MSCCCRDQSILSHAPEHPVPPAFGPRQVLGKIHPVEVSRFWQGSQGCCFCDRDVSNGLSEVGPCGDLDTIGAPTEINLIQVELKDLIFREVLLDAPSKDHLSDF